MKVAHICGNSYTANLNGTNVCIYMLDETRAIFIDTGEIEDKELYKFLNKKEIKPVAIINTHLHIDHIGNNRALCQKYGCKVYCSPVEVRDRCSGCADFASFLTENCVEGKQMVEGAEFTIISTPGHSSGHQSVVTPDGVCCLGDAVLSLSKLKTSRIPYLYNAENAVKSLRKLLDWPLYPYYLAAHNGIIESEQIKETILANLNKEESLRRTIIDVVSKGIAMDSLKDNVMRAAGVENPTTRGLFWMQDSVKTRIDDLIKQGKLKGNNQKVFPAVTNNKGHL